MSRLNDNVAYVLGLDIGIASVGAALIGDGAIHGLHVRAFDKAETAKEGDPLNKIRREARGTRRRLRRRAYRLLRLRQRMVLEGILPDEHSIPMTIAATPWALRADGLDRLLNAEEWAAVLYHIVKHRGFQSTRKSDIQDDEKAGQMLSAVTENQKRRQEGGWRTVGEMLAHDPKYEESKRNKDGQYQHTLSRSDLEHELATLFEQQRALGNTHASSSFQQLVHKLLMARRPALSGDALLAMVGRCTFEPDEFRAPKASISFERFIWLQKLNNLRVGAPGDMHPLSPNDRQTLIQLPFEQASLKYQQVRAKLGIPPDHRFNSLNYRIRKESEDELATEKAMLFEARAFHKLRRAYLAAGLSDFWARDACDDERLDYLAYAQSVYKNDAEAREFLNEQGVEPTIIDAVLAVPFDGFGHLSLKAIRKLLPYLEQGLRYDEAVQASGYRHHSHLVSQTKQRYLPRIQHDEFRNPVVYRALNQARKLVNAIVREYGPPSSIHIELARDLSRPFKERKDIERDQAKYQERKEQDVQWFKTTFGLEPRKDQLTKSRLYREQDGQCAYTRKPIRPEWLLRDNYVEIDHALPYSRSFDDGMNNKVLVLTAENRNKGNRTPYEYLDGANDSAAWRLFEASIRGNPKYRKAKRDRLLRKDFSEQAAEGFRERNLSDTRYIARAFKRMIDEHLQLAEDAKAKRSVVVSGQLTAFLRHHWGLTKIRKDGDKHHALDAAVVAACGHDLVKRLSDYARHGELKQVRSGFTDPTSGEILDMSALRKLDADFPRPWPWFRDELTARLSDNPSTALANIPDYPKELAEAAHPIRVSRPPRRRGTGQAHHETIRSTRLASEGLSVIKTPITKLKLKDIPRIVGFDDPRNAALIKALQERLIAHGDKPDQAFKEALYKPGRSEPRPQVKTVKLTDTQKSGHPVRHGIANNGDMVRIDLFTNGKHFFVVPLYVADAVKAQIPNRAVIGGKAEDQWTEMNPSQGTHFLFSVYPGDWLKLQFKGKPSIEGYFGSMDRSTGAISIWTHDRSHNVGKAGLIRSIGIKTALNVQKFHVDVLGNLHPAAPEERQPLPVSGDQAKDR
ncbi:MAG: type II CRISPR RNA-guided endonuclease Cas9 [Gammaproteobacteria bacterium]|nr:type II CRISPR RNA-guided endonuclease Cas9 [Gammaproteobacteria bacterium]MCP5137749.1 type II CRISPR RNA-guided endonuclease Cas9 [Gammaproteobacteria bacterium]